MLIALIISLLFNILLGYLTWINFTKLEKLTEHVTQVTAYNEACIQFIGSMFFKFKEAQIKMKEVDKLGAFASDDQVGFAFKDIQDAIDEVYDYITKYVNEEEEQKK